MKIIIAGAGEVGTHLAKLLARESFDTTLIDENPEALRDLDMNYDLLTYTGSPTSIVSLKECNVHKADLFIAVTPYESVNMTSCMLATNLGAKKTLARIENFEYLQPENKEFFFSLGVDFLIFPENLAAEQIVESLKYPWLRQNLSFCNDALIMVAIKVRKDALILNKKFSTGYFDHGKYRVVAIKRKNRTIIPSGNDEILADDVVYFITMKENFDYVSEQAGKKEFQIKNVMIMGGSRIAQRTVKFLPHNMDVKILERNKEKCYQIAECVGNALIINADGRNVEALQAEGIEDVDAFVATTSNSEANILACVEAKRLGVKKTIAEVENIDYLQLAEELEIGTVINKKLIAASYIYQLTLDADVLEVRSLTSADAEVVEFIVKPNSKITRGKIKDIKLPENVNIGGIVREGVGSIVYGNTQIQAGDHIIVFCASSTIRKVESLFN
jgi:trk system potassium uptake protein TrkA